MAARSAYRRTSIGSGYDEYRAVVGGSLLTVILVAGVAFMVHSWSGSDQP